MKTSPLSALLALGVGVLLQAATLSAADLYAVNVHGTCKLVNDSDRIVNTRFNNATILGEYAASQEPAPDVRTLKLAYDPENDRIVIVDPAGEILAEVLTFGVPTSVADSADSKRVRFVFVFPEGSSEAIGSAILTEKITRDGESNIIRITSQGTIQYATAATESTPAQVCNGNFTVGKKLLFATPPPAP